MNRQEQTRAKQRQKAQKVNFTPAMDALIFKLYRENIARQGLVKKTALAFGVPRHVISRRAAAIGAYTPLKKEPAWDEKELSILEHNAQLSVEVIKKKLSAAGYQRSIAGIHLKRKRMRFLKNMDGMSAMTVAEFFGVDSHWVTNKIKQGLLKAEKRGTGRTEKQGGDIYFIKEKDLRRFIVNNPEIIDLRKVEKFYFIELLANGGMH